MNESVSNTISALGYYTLYKNHGNNQIGYWEGWVEDPNYVVIRHAKTLNGKAVTHQYTVEGKNIGKANETTPMQQAKLELASRVKKQLDKGYVHTLEEAGQPATNSLGLLKPMLATPIDKVKPESITWDSAFVQPKLDGHRALFVDGILYSRGGKEISLPHITRAIKDAGLDHLHLDGELYIHGYSLQELSALIKRDQAGTEHLEYHIYDHVHPGAYHERVSVLASHFMKTSHPRLRAVETYVANDMDMVMAKHQDFRKAGYEGTMLRFGDEEYRDGKRSRTLLKIKEFQDAEFKIVGYEQGKPYVRPEGAFQVPVWICETPDGKTFTVTAPGTMEEKDIQWRNREAYVRRQLTVKYHYLSKDGIPQLPVALRFREDI